MGKSNQSRPLATASIAWNNFEMGETKMKSASVRRWAASTVAVSLLAATAPAWAKDPKPKGGSAKPVEPAVAPTPAPAPAAAEAWAEGVQASEQEQARTLAGEAGTLLAKNDFGRAADIYIDALKHWPNHPGIHYNLLQCLVSLGRWLEAAAAIRGVAEYPQYLSRLSEEQRVQFETYKGVVDKSLATVKVSTTQDGVEVTLDGERIVAGKGTGEKVVTVGSHALVATKDGFETLTKSLSLNGGEAYVEEISLKPQVVVKTYERRWKKTWMPWVIAGSGAGVAMLGGAAMLIARSDMNLYNSAIESNCSATACNPDELQDVAWYQDAESRKTRAFIENGVGIGLVAAGGAALVTGLVMVALNQPKEVEKKGPTVAVSPNLDGGFSVSLASGF
jgi:tetratricopeptide (TPR) repeat protein